MACTGIAPFRFDGNLRSSGNPFSKHLVGEGTLEATLFRLSTGIEGGGVSYNFEASPTPEPATLSLPTTGAMVTGAWMSRRRRTNDRCALE